jgi:hypothetical protein
VDARVIEIAGDAVEVMKADRRPGPFLLPITWTFSFADNLTEIRVRALLLSLYRFVVSACSSCRLSIGAPPDEVQRRRCT